MELKRSLSENRNQKGAVVVEFAILAGLLIVIVFGIIEFGFIWLQSHYIANAAREGARIASKPGFADEDAREEAAEAAVQDYLKQFFLYSDDLVNDLQDPPPANIGNCNTTNFLCVVVEQADDLITGAGGLELPGIKVTVRVRTEQIWKPILFSLVQILPGVMSAQADITSVTQSATFATQN